ncbi:MAG: outer membrane protein assembly factor BamA [Candidatus Omnitrophota bacterium]
MKKRIFLAGLLIAVFIVGHSFGAWAQSGQGAGKRVSDIRIKGNSAVSTATILSRIKLNPGDVFEEMALNKEMKRLYATGYFSDVFVETEEHEEGVIVIFTVVEKPVIGSFEFRGNTKIKTPRLSKKLTVKEGDMLDQSLIAQDISSLKVYYVEEGYSQVQIDQKVETDPATGKAKVIFLINEGLPLKIVSIKFEGNSSIPSAELEKYMETKTAWWFIRKGAYDDQKFQSDLDRIRSIYRSKGFLDAQVTSRIDYLEDGKSIGLVVVANEGKQYVVGDMSVTGSLAFPEKEIRGKIKIKTGDAFDYARIREDVDSVRTFYYDKGYMDAEIDLRHKYNVATERMDLEFDIQAHDEIYVGGINVLGNEKTKDKVIRREFRVYPGEKYNGDKLKRSKERIYNLGYFEDVYFETVPTDDPDIKDLNVTVKETKTGELSFGGGYSSVDAFIGFAQIRQRNFDITNFPTFTGGGQDLTIRGEIGSARSNYLLSWTDPWIFDYPYLFGFDLYREENDKYGESGYDYDETRMGGSLRLGKELTDYLNTGLIYNLEEVKIASIPDVASQDLKDEEGTNMISRLTWNLEWDKRDNRYSPTKGWLTGISLENAGGVIGGDKDFIKTYAHASVYHSIMESLVLELKGRAGTVSPYADTHKVPIYERFFAGGATTIRGYEQRAVGPRDPNDKNLYIGGESLVVGNAELTFPIFKKLVKGAVFYDVGTVEAKVADMFKTGGYKQGAGVGVRVKTPIGPVKLDWGYPLSENHGDKKEGQFYFSVSHGF